MCYEVFNYPGCRAAFDKENFNLSDCQHFSVHSRDEISRVRFRISHTDEGEAEREAEGAWAAAITEALAQGAGEEVEKCVVDLVDNPCEIFLDEVLSQDLRIIGRLIILHGEPVHISLPYIRGIHQRYVQE